MVYICIVQGCRKRPEPYVRTLHGFPENTETINAWNEFVKKTNPKWNGNTPSSRICSEHFLPACYKNHMAWSMRCVRTLELIDDFQVPTIHPAEMEDESKAGVKESLDLPTSSSLVAPEEIKQEESNCPPAVKTEVIQECHLRAVYPMLYVVRHVGSQTDPPSHWPSTRSVGTQLSSNRLFDFRSTASQAKPMSQDLGVCTEILDSPMLLLQPALVKRPSKRLRLNLEPKEQAASECITTTEVQDT